MAAVCNWREDHVPAVCFRYSTQGQACATSVILLRTLSVLVLRTLAVLVGLMWIVLGFISLFVDDPPFEPKILATVITLLGVYCLACGLAGKNIYRYRKL